MFWSETETAIIRATSASCGEREGCSVTGALPFDGVCPVFIDPAALAQ